jgi:allene oxide cyclase
MKGRLLASVLIAVFVVAAVGVAVGAGGGSSDPTIRVIEHADTDVVRHIGPPGEEDSAGDVLAFSNPVFNAANKKKVGRDNGQCVRTAAGRAWECQWSISLSGGQITVEGPFYDGKDSILAITGGTGKYRNASGQMRLHARNDKETEYDFTYEVEK